MLQSFEKWFISMFKYIPFALEENVLLFGMKIGVDGTDQAG
jgi:hypothetical protein